jgi:hypothetical protein
MRGLRTHDARDRAERVLRKIRRTLGPARDGVDRNELIGRVRLQQRDEHLLDEGRAGGAVEFEDHDELGVCGLLTMAIDDLVPACHPISTCSGRPRAVSGGLGRPRGERNV